MVDFPRQARPLSAICQSLGRCAPRTSIRVRIGSSGRPARQVASHWPARAIGEPALAGRPIACRIVSRRWLGCRRSSYADGRQTRWLSLPRAGQLPSRRSTFGGAASCGPLGMESSEPRDNRTQLGGKKKCETDEKKSPSPKTASTYPELALRPNLEWLQLVVARLARRPGSVGRLDAHLLLGERQPPRCQLGQNAHVSRHNQPDGTS